MRHWGTRLGQIALGGALAASGVTIGESYAQRLPYHAGYFLVSTEDVVKEPPPRAGRAVVVVIDGLGLSFAREVGAMQRLLAEGQCRVTDVGPISVSRPSYSVISTGLEQDRSGVRANEAPMPLAAESIWDVAQAAGLEVVGVSDVPWWQELFPGGFDRHAVRPQADDYLATHELGDVTLIHASYVDRAGHQFGAASPEYAAAVARTDAELTALIGRLDLARDLIVVTADHGHVARGGHGGQDPAVREVWTCFAGPGVARAGEAAAIDSHAIAGALAVLLGLPFPRHMRAGPGEDDLDEALAIAGAMPAEYLADRRAGVERARAASASALAGWLGRPGTWAELYAREGRWRALRAGLVGLVIAVGFVAAGRLRRLDARRMLRLAGWCAAVGALAVALHVAWLGSFDWTAINLRQRYIPAASVVCAVAGVLGVIWHRVRRPDEPLAADLLTLGTLGLALNLGHIAAWGWPLGFPMPGPALLLVPFFASFFAGIVGVLGALAAAWALVRGRASG